MATLKMNIEEARSTSQAIQTSVGQVETELGTLKNRVTSMVGSEWISAAANQFGTEFQTWETQLKALLTQMTELRQRLETEIAQWEEMASRLN